MPKRDPKRLKGVYVKMSNETHKNFRLRLCMRSISMQEALETFATLVGDGNEAFNFMFDKIVRDRVKVELDIVNKKCAVDPNVRSIPRRYVDDLDSESLYDIINNDHKK